MLYSIIILITYIIVFLHQTALCSLEKRYFHNLDPNIQKKCYSRFLNNQDFKLLSELSSNLFKNNDNQKYYGYIYTQYALNSENFLFFKNSIFSKYFHSYFFKNILSLGFGYNIFNGPVYFSHIEFAPSLYYVNNIYEKDYSKILFNNSLMYSYQLIRNIYYAQCLTTLSNFKHVATKLEHTLSVPIKENILFLKFSYNIMINENKFHSVLPNMNKYISISILYVI